MDCLTLYTSSGLYNGTTHGLTDSKSELSFLVQLVMSNSSFSSRSRPRSPLLLLCDNVRNCRLLAFLLTWNIPHLQKLSWLSHARLCYCLPSSAVNPSSSPPLLQPLPCFQLIALTTIEREPCRRHPESHSTILRQTCQRATNCPWLNLKAKLSSLSM